jgi:hypothetical protein
MDERDTPRIRTIDMRTYPSMLEAIGRVTTVSAELSVSVVQFGAAVMGTDLMYALQEDKTLGVQWKQVQSVISLVNGTAARKTAEITSETQQEAMNVLKRAWPVVEYRNRIVHDVWRSDPTDEQPERIAGRRATRWSKDSIETNIGSLHRLSSVLFGVAVAFSRLQDHVQSHRSGRQPFSTGLAADCARAIADVEGLVQSTDPLWTWKVTQSPYR